MNNKEARAAIGLDIGGTKIAAGVVLWPSGEVIHRLVIPTKPRRGGEAVLRDTLRLAETLTQWAHSNNVRVAGIGAGVAELVDHDGNVTSEQTIRWRRIAVRQALSRVAPAQIESDVRAAALGESIFGAGKDVPIFVYVTVGTGISYCLVQDGLPFRGAKGNAITFATSPLSTTCERCGAKLRPVLEKFASGPAIAKRYARARRETNSRARVPRLTSEAILLRARNGDHAALQVVRSAGEALGVQTAFLVNVLDPARIVVGGGLGVAGGIYWRSFVQACRDHIFADSARRIPIVPAALGVDAGLIGAAATVFHKDRIDST